MGFKGRRIGAVVGAVIVAVVLIGCGSGGGSGVDSSGLSGPDAKSSKSGAGAPAGVYKFGQTIKFDDGSTMKVSEPVKFKTDEYAITEGKQPMYVKFKATFVNKTNEVYDPSLTTASASAGGEEAKSVFQTGLSAPSNKCCRGSP